jgi:hypothetical protein
MNTTTLFIGVITGAFGSGYFIYGKRQQRAVPMLSGAILCFYPYFTDNIWILCIVGAVLLIVPFFLDF